MKRIIALAGFLGVFAAVACAQTTCDSYTQTLKPTDITISDQNEHSDGDHHVSTGHASAPLLQGLQGTCTYTSGGTPNCNTKCFITANPLSSSESGSLTALGSHLAAVGWADGSGAAVNGGANCTGILGGGATNCFLVFGTCSINVGFTNGVFSLNTNGHEVWRGSNNVPFNCNAVADPTYQTAGGPPPDPCAIDRASPDCCAINPSDACPPLISSESPIIIDTEGEGFHLTSAANGVLFDMQGNSHPLQLGWTDPHFKNAFLALPGEDGLVHNGTQLFGNFTPQPASAHPNGFLALAEFDKQENGGNGDGMIDEHDAVFSRLRLWIDENHDGISQPNELHTLPELGVYSLSLRYFESRKEDQFANQFRYKARVNPEQGHRDTRDATPSGEPARWTYDVFLTTH